MQPKDTARLYFKLIEQNYLEELFQLHSNPEVMKYIRQPDQSLSDTQKTIDIQLQNAHRHKGLGLFCAHLKDNNDFIGWGYIYHLAFDESQLVEVGYRLSPRFWGKGHATELAQSLTTYGHEELKLPRLCAVTDPHHIKSQNVLKKIGFQYIDNRQAYDHQCSYFEHSYSSPS